MILDQMKNRLTYQAGMPGIATALEKMAAYTPDNYPGGRVEIDADALYLLLNTYETHDAESARMEAHVRYIDVMYMVEGEEIIYVKPTDRLSETTKPYDEACDALLAKLDPDAMPIRLCAGDFVVLFPQDAHAPACCVDKPRIVKKIIGKVKI